jgi:predicted CXXCH cytochrome family protein
VPALFPPWSNTPYRIAIAFVALTLVAAIAAPILLVRTPYSTQQFRPVGQPVEFDHRHHVRDDGIDCRYCHPGAESQARAGIPATEVCVGCHGQIWNDSPLLAPVRESFATGTPIRWRRVHDLPDFVYFHHGVHTQAGVGCASCHGAVERMARVYRVAPMTMGWCLDCHRDPPGPADHGRAVTRLSTCTACHR